VFTDVAMPNMNGIQLAKIVSQRWPHIGIVVTSGALPPGVALDLPAGARFVAKPYNPDTVLQEIAAVAPTQVGSPSRYRASQHCNPVSLMGQADLHSRYPNQRNEWDAASLTWSPLSPPNAGEHFFAGLFPALRQTRTPVRPLDRRLGRT
jgi:DNA-binding NarL/FixJ family response regulator